MTLITNEDILVLLISPFFYIFGGLAILTICVNFLNLNSVLSIYSQLLVLPIYESCIIFGNLITAGIIMNEFIYYSWKELALISLGVFITVIGITNKVYHISKKEKESDNQVSD